MRISGHDGFRVAIAPALADNYVYLVQAAGAREAVVVDPAEARVARAAADLLGARIACVLDTHHHPDHTGGNAALRRATGCAVLGPANEDIPARTGALSGGEELEIAGLRVQVLSVPGHTRGHLAYRIGDALFSGDALFLAGCGRLFEGTPAGMWASLARLARLPGATRIYCAHEYALANLRFAASLSSPRQAKVEARLARVGRLREAGLPSVPGTIAEERVTNPFLWPLDAAMRAWIAAHFGVDADDPVACFAALRRARDAWRG